MPLLAGPLKSALAGKTVDDCEIFVAHRDRDGGVWLGVSARPLGHPSGAVLVARDITAAKEAEKIVVEQSVLVELIGRVTLLANQASEGTSALHECLVAFCSLLGWSAGRVLEVRQDDLVPNGVAFTDVPALEARLAEPAAAGSAAAMAIAKGHGLVCDIEPELGMTRALAFPVVVDDIPCAVVECLGPESAMSDERVTALLPFLSGQLSRVLEREFRFRQISRENVTDAATGLCNRRGFMSLAGNALERARVAGEPALLFFFDQDGLKRINDELGHEAGDRALAMMAAALRQTFRDRDIVARLGGDEFVALAPRCAEASGQAILGRFYENVTRMNAASSEAFVVAASVGVVACDASSELVELLQRADALMYEDKRRRRAAR